MAVRSPLMMAVVALTGCAARIAAPAAPPLSPAVVAALHAPRDEDGDLVPDDRDRCPAKPEDRDDYDDGDGCPDADNDRDQVADEADACPDTPEDYDHAEDRDGCPDPDNDGDRIADARDQCPNDPEVYNGIDDADGCPDTGSMEIVSGCPPLPVVIHFREGSAEIELHDQHRRDLAGRADELAARPDVERVVVSGHASGPAEAVRGVHLSRARAQAVIEALVARGVARERLVPAGYGTHCPVDPRRTPEAYVQNRRVTFAVVQRAGERTAASIGCPRGRRYDPPGIGPPAPGY